jgi:hypothetical protein
VLDLSEDGKEMLEKIEKSFYESIEIAESDISKKLKETLENASNVN